MLNCNYLQWGYLEDKYFPKWGFIEGWACVWNPPNSLTPSRGSWLQQQLLGIHLLQFFGFLFLFQVDMDPLLRAEELLPHHHHLPHTLSPHLPEDSRLHKDFHRAMAPLHHLVSDPQELEHIQLQVQLSPFPHRLLDFDFPPVFHLSLITFPRLYILSYN